MNPGEPKNEDGPEISEREAFTPEGLSFIEAVEVPQKRGRGRPKKNPDEPPLTVGGKSESAKVYTLNAGGGAIPKAPRQKAPQNLDGLKVSLSMLHMAIAARAGDPSFMLTDDECHLLAKAISDLFAYYKIELSGKRGAWASLGMCVCAIYGPKVAPKIMGLVMGRMINGRPPVPQA